MDIHMVLFTPENSSPQVLFDEADLSSYGDNWQLLGKAKVTFEVCDIDIPGIQIESLKQQKQKILAEAHVRAEQIEQQIQSLLAIEYQPETEGAA
jgi:hypothetical protein